MGKSVKELKTPVWRTEIQRSALWGERSTKQHETGNQFLFVEVWCVFVDRSCSLA
jgi:hypothetical protein